MNNPELPLDPNLQTSNLLITFLKYASIVMQDTKGKQKAGLESFLILLPVYRHCLFLLNNHTVFSCSGQERRIISLLERYTSWSGSKPESILDPVHYGFFNL